MSSRAEEHFDVIGNYYHIIDPERTLSEIERAKKEAEILNNMPNGFPKALLHISESEPHLHGLLAPLSRAKAPTYILETNG